jgi:hypothetical protein
MTGPYGPFKSTADVAALALIEPLHGLSFALLHLACMRLLGEIVPPGLAATAQALSVLIQAVASAGEPPPARGPAGTIPRSRRRIAGRGWLPRWVSRPRRAASVLVLIFDEFADLILAGRDEKKEFENLVARIAGKGRAAGYSLGFGDAAPRPSRGHRAH